MGARSFGKMKLFLLVSALCASYFSVEALLDNPQEILANFKDKYNNSKSDLIFLLDTSGSVRPWGFNTEKIFVDSLLNEFSVAPYSTRVSVITFGTEVKTDINYIDIDGTELDKNKCEFKPKFQYQVRFRGGMTNMKEGFARAINLLQTTINKGRKRIGVHTVVMMITDGYWNMGNPLGNTATLKSTYGVDIFAVGVAGYSIYQLNQIASSSQHVLRFNSFNKFKELAMYIRGGKLSTSIPSPVFVDDDNKKDVFNNRVRGLSGGILCPMFFTVQSERSARSVRKTEAKIFSQTD